MMSTSPLSLDKKSATSSSSWTERAEESCAQTAGSEPQHQSFDAEQLQLLQAALDAGTDVDAADAACVDVDCAAVTCVDAASVDVDCVLEGGCDGWPWAA